MKNDFIRIVFLTIIVVLVAYIIRITSNYDTPIDISESISYYSTNDSIAEVNQDANWLLNSPQNTLNNFSTSKTEVLWYQIPLPIFDKGSAIYFTSLTCNAYALYDSNGNLLTASSISNSPFNELTLRLVLDTNLSSKIIYLKIDPTINHLGITTPIYIGDSKILESMYMRHNILDIYFGFLFVIGGLIILVSGFFLNKQMRIMSFSLALIMVSMGYAMIYSNTNFKFYYSNIQDLLQNMNYIAFIFTTIGLTIFFKNALYQNTQKKILNYLLAFQLIYTIISLMTIIVGVLSHYEIFQLKNITLHALFNIVFAIQYIILMTLTIREANKNHAMARILLPVFIALLLTILMDIIIFFISNNNYESLSMWKWGALLCMFTFVRLLIIKTLNSNHETRIPISSNESEKISRPKSKKTLTKLESTDYLTGLLNRPGIFKALETALEVTKLNSNPLTLAFCDIDGLKRINESYDYYFADTILMSLSKLFKKNLDPSAIIGRWAGEEFAFILPNTTSIQAKKDLEYPQ